MKITWQYFILVLWVAVSSGCKDPVRLPPPAAGSWLVFLCKASDAPGEPNTPDYYRALFDSNQRDLMYDYFQAMSGGALDVSGTEVYGWFRMAGVNRDQLSPTVRNLTTTPGRWQTLLDCKSAGVAALLAAGKSIDPDKYAGIIAVINVDVDAGQIGKDVVANAFEPASFYGHEMLHAMTYPPHALPHAHIMSQDTTAHHSWDSGGDSEYGDCWDIMSYNVSCLLSFDTATHGKQGPELNMAYRQKLGWVPPARIAVIDNRNIAPSTVTLAPLSDPGLPGFLMAKIEMAGLGSYAVEYRVPGGFDRGMQISVVLIRELRSNGETYLVKREDGKPYWVQGEQFTDAGSFISINIDAITPQAATITVNPRFSIAANAGDRCGDKHLGVMRQCPVGTTCNPRRVTPPRPDPVFFSTDYFCL